MNLLVAAWSLTVISGIHLTAMDPLDRIFPDHPSPPPSSYEPHVPRGGTTSFLFALRSEESQSCHLNVSPPTDIHGNPLLAEWGTFRLLHVPVEANNNGGSRTQVGVKPPVDWQASFIREAPFELAEVLVASETIDLSPGRTMGVLLDLTVHEEATPGIYEGHLEISGNADEAQAPFALHVHGITSPSIPSLKTTYWLSPNPDDLCVADPPPWWSPRHWELLANTAGTLRSFGQEHIYTPIIDGKEPLIQIRTQSNGEYHFDYARFDKWVKLFLDAGFTTIEGHHVGGGHTIGIPPMGHWGGVWILDERSNKKQLLIPQKGDAESWFDFLPIFYQSLHSHLEEQQWSDIYVQCQLDEPRDPAEYKRLADLAREYLPGIPTKDAINSQPVSFSPLVDIQVFSLITLAKNQNLAEERRTNGQKVWMYHCCSPYPPYPNRHLDERLTDSRLYPWLAHMLGAEGYLYWAANMYRGADPYKTSVGPLPNGSQSPGHPPGDNWFFYPSNDGLIPSMRMVAFREGLLDHALFAQLIEKNQERAREIMASIARSTTDYSTSPSDFHEARRKLLEALER